MQTSAFQARQEKYLDFLTAKDSTGFLRRQANFLLSSILINSSLETKLASATLKVSEAKKSDCQALVAILDLAYLSRYVAEVDEKKSMSNFTKSGKTKNLVVKAKIGQHGREIVVATLQLVIGQAADIEHPLRSNLELFKLFALRDQTARWPHQKSQKIPVELGRFAFQPIFDVLTWEADLATKKRWLKIKQILTAKLWQVVQQELEPVDNYELMVVTAEQVKNFLRDLKIKITPVSDAVLAKNDLVTYLKNNFASYWSQAHLYTIEL